MSLLKPCKGLIVGYTEFLPALARRPIRAGRAVSLSTPRVGAFCRVFCILIVDCTVAGRQGATHRPVVARVLHLPQGEFLRHLCCLSSRLNLGHLDSGVGRTAHGKVRGACNACSPFHDDHGRDFVCCLARTHAGAAT